MFYLNMKSHSTVGFSVGVKTTNTQTQAQASSPPVSEQVRAAFCRFTLDSYRSETCRNWTERAGEITEEGGRRQ